MVDDAGPVASGLAACAPHPDNGNAIAKAAIDEKSLRWFEVLETRGHIEDGKIAHWQVRVKIGATLD